MADLQQWTWRSHRSGFARTAPLWLDWEVDLSAMSDDYLFEDADAVALWHLWVPRATEVHGDLVHISWFVANEDVGTFEFAPFQVQISPTSVGDFLTDFTWPMSIDDGERLNWLTLPVVEKRWCAEQADKGGFISEALGGWKPSPLQPTMSVSALGRAAGLTPGPGVNRQAGNS